MSHYYKLARINNWVYTTLFVPRVVFLSTCLKLYFFDNKEEHFFMK